MPWLLDWHATRRWPVGSGTDIADQAGGGTVTNTGGGPVTIRDTSYSDGGWSDAQVQQYVDSVVSAAGYTVSTVAVSRPLEAAPYVVVAVPDRQAYRMTLGALAQRLAQGQDGSGQPFEGFCLRMEFADGTPIGGTFSMSRLDAGGWWFNPQLTLDPGIAHG